MAEESGSTRPKALKINLDGRKFGTFAEIGAGQEVARWFFHAGKAAGTIAKTISAYDMAISDGLYGPTQRYVSRQRLEAMVENAFKRLVERLDRAVRQLQQDCPPAQDLVAIMEMTLNNLMSEQAIDHQDFLARVDILGALGKMVVISNYTRFDCVTSYLRRYTQNWIGMAMGVPTLREVFEEKYYTEMEGGILEGVGRLFQRRVKLFIYPTRESDAGEVTTSDRLDVKPELNHLYRHLVENGYIASIREFDAGELHVTPGAVLAFIQIGRASCRERV